MIAYTRKSKPELKSPGTSKQDQKMVSYKLRINTQTKRPMIERKQNVAIAGKGREVKQGKRKTACFYADWMIL